MFRRNDPQSEAVDSLVVEEDVSAGIEALGVQPTEETEASYDDEPSAEMLHRGCIHPYGPRGPPFRTDRHHASENGQERWSTLQRTNVGVEKLISTCVFFCVLM